MIATPGFFSGDSLSHPYTGILTLPTNLTCIIVEFVFEKGRIKCLIKQVK